MARITSRTASRNIEANLSVALACMSFSHDASLAA
jgi:hypothetical protein